MLSSAGRGATMLSSAGDGKLADAARGLAASFFTDKDYPRAHLLLGLNAGDHFLEGKAASGGGGGIGRCCGAYAKAPQQQLMYAMSFEHHEQSGGGAFWDPYTGGGGERSDTTPPTTNLQEAGPWAKYLGSGATSRITSLDEVSFDPKEPYFNQPSAFAPSSLSSPGGAPVARAPANSAYWTPADVVGDRKEWVHAGMGEIPGVSWGQQFGAAEQLERETRREQVALDEQVIKLPPSP